MAWPWLTPVLPALAFPLTLRQGRSSLLESREDRMIVNPDTGRIILVGETANARTIYTVVSSCCLIVLTLLLGYRARTLKNNVFKKLNMTSVLILLLFFFGILFIFCTLVVQTGLGLSTHVICYASAIICLVFYTGNKLTIYVFLLERARIVRAPFLPRQRDWLWMVGMVIILGGFGTIAIIGYTSPIVELSQVDGRCRIGLPPKVSFPLLSFDVGVNFLLTGLFFWLLKPVLNLHGGSWLAGIFGKRFENAVRKLTGQSSVEAEDPHPQLGVVKRSIKSLLWKSLIGSMLVMVPTVANMAQFYIMKGRELGWICLTICTLDVSWGVLVINWLTTGSAEAEKNLNESIMTMRGEFDSGTSGERMLNRLPRVRQNSTTTTEELLQVPSRVHTSGMDDRKSVEVLTKPAAVF